MGKISPSLQNLRVVAEGELRSIWEPDHNMPVGQGKDVGFYSTWDWKALEDFEGVISSCYILTGHSVFCEENKLSGGRNRETS